MSDGGPAFPHSGHDDHHGDIAYPDAGMSLRDWFAGQALAGLIHRGFTEFGNRESGYTALAYTYADAMLKQREDNT